MSEQNTLTIFTKAAQMLAECDSIQKAKELRDLAITAGEWAKRKCMGEEAILHCRSYALEAERKMGQILKDTELAQGRRTDLVTTRHQVEPTLSELGISKKQSSRAQQLADIPEPSFRKIVKGLETRAQARREEVKAIERAQMEAAAKTIDLQIEKDLTSVYDLRHCSCKELFASGIKPDAIITDPPYPREFLNVFSELSLAAKDVPLVAVMVGQSYLPEVLQRLCENLEYRWTLAYLTPGGQAVQQFPAKVNCFWKPVLLFGKAAQWIGDVTKSDVNDNDKDHHHWGQSESGMADLIMRLTKPGQLVCDPFLGGGTTAIVSGALNRLFVGCDIDKKCIDETMLRIKASL